jgi:predicted heme/steroid binding protein
MVFPEVSISELAKKNGVDSNDTWIAFKGAVYDVSDSKLWKNGMHYEHWAGQDLTDELKDAPHTKKVFERLQQVAVLKK